MERSPSIMVLVEDLKIRDLFAIASCQGMMARDTFDEGQSTPQQRARLAYIEADAMMAEREKTK